MFSRELSKTFAFVADDTAERSEAGDFKADEPEAKGRAIGFMVEADKPRGASLYLDSVCYQGPPAPDIPAAASAERAAPLETAGPIAPAPGVRLLLVASASLAAGAEAQQTALTIYSSARPGAIPPELYRPVPGQGVPYGMAVPGYAMVRQTRGLQLATGTNRIDFRDVAAYIDPTTVSFESLTAPATTRVIEQSFQFDLVSTAKLMDRYIDQTITVDRAAGDTVLPITGRLLSTEGGLVLSGEDGQIHAVQDYRGVHFPTLPGGLITRPTLVWDVLAEQAGEHARAERRLGLRVLGERLRGRP